MMRPSPRTRREKSRLIEEGPEAAEEEEVEVEAEASGVVEDVGEEEDSRPDLLTVVGGHNDQTLKQGCHRRVVSD